MHVLAFDTSTDITAVAVTRDGQVLAEAHEPSQEKHAEILLSRVQACLARAGLALAEIDLFAVGIGPGSFTGVRVGLATAKGFALGTGKPVRGESSLSTLAEAAFASGSVAEGTLCVPLLDAHKGEVFAAVYARAAGGELECVVPGFHALPEAALARLSEAVGGKPHAVFGGGYRRYAERLPLLSAGRALEVALDVPRASALAALALRHYEREGASDLVRLSPEYLRGSDAQLPSRPLRL